MNSTVLITPEALIGFFEREKTTENVFLTIFEGKLGITFRVIPYLRNINRKMELDTFF